MSNGTHWRSMTEREFLYAYDLQGREVTVTIEKVVAGAIKSTGGKSTKKPVVYFKGKSKPLALNATNAKTIASLYGNYVEDWIGERIIIYPTTTEMAGETVDCIRVRNKKPGAEQPAQNGNGKKAWDAPPDDADLTSPTEPQS